MTYEKYQKAWQRRTTESILQIKKLAHNAEKVAEKCAIVLHKDFGVRRVYLFGSLAEGYFRKSSDIDLVVEGLDGHYYFKALCKIGQVSKDFNVDLIPFEDYNDKELVLEKGILFDEQKQKWQIHPPDLHY